VAYFAGSMPQNDAKVEQRRLRSSYLTSTISIALLLFLLGMVGVLLLYTNRLSNYIKENIHFKIILYDNLAEAEILRIKKSLDVKSYVKETKYINKEEAAVALRESLGEDFIETLGYNPLSPTIEVKFLASYANNDSIPVIEKDLKEFSGIKEVYYQKNLIQEVNENVKKISLIILFFSLLLLAIALFLINNTIRLTIYSRRFLIRTMQLVGATPGFVRRPFLYRSAIQGLVGALVAILLISTPLYFLQDQLDELIKLNDIQLILILFPSIILLGISLNWISTYMAVSKYLRIKTDKLYT
jgi:cell division transport system permease protein